MPARPHTEPGPAHGILGSPLWPPGVSAARVTELHCAPAVLRGMEQGRPFQFFSPVAPLKPRWPPRVLVQTGGRPRLRVWPAGPSYMRVPAGQKRLERPADTGMKAGLVECVTACPASHSCWVLRDIRFQRRECRREQATGTLSPGQDGAPGGGRSVPLRRRLRTARRMVGAAGGSRAELGALSCVAQPGPCVNTRCPSVCTDVQKPPFQRASVCLSVHWEVKQGSSSVSVGSRS